jgi:hypothetical protein
MEESMKYSARLILFISLAFMLGGCASPRPPTYYLLEPAFVAGDPDGDGQPCMVIGLRPVRIPSYIDRPQIMVRTGRNELAISESNLWAEPLDENIARVISRNLETLTCAEVVNILPAGRSGPADYTLRIQVAAFEGGPGGEAVLEAGWTLSKGESRRTITSQRSRFTKPVPGDDYTYLVSAYSELVARLSGEIARAIADLPPTLPRN